jgi:hypothetical protein
MCAHGKLTKVGKVLWLGTAGVMVAGLLAARLEAQSYVLSQNGTTVGSAELKIDRQGGGFAFDSKANVKMPGLDYSVDAKQALDGGYHLQHVSLDGKVNGTGAKVETGAQGQQFLMNIDANGRAIHTPLAFHPLAVFMPDFDPAGLQAMLYLGAAHNNAGIWTLVPKQTGSTSAMRIATDADMQGTLDGRQIGVHHYSVTYDATKMEVFSGPANELLQTEWTNEGFALARKGFALTPPKRAGLAPKQPAQQQPAQPQQPVQPQQ